MTIASIFLLDAFCQDANHVGIIVNRNSAESRLLGNFYRELRNIPKENVLSINVPENENISRELYEKSVEDTLRRQLSQTPEHSIRYLVTTRGCPLRILPASDENRSQDKAFLTSSAAFESELINVKSRFVVKAGWKRRSLNSMDTNELMVFRLDGPGLIQIQNTLRAGIKAEKRGLNGNFCIDARGMKDTASAYGQYDASLRKLAMGLKERLPNIKIIFNDTEELFKKGDCPQTTLYVGWYSLSRYIDAFEWLPGSLGFHIASGEARSFQQKNEQGWCTRMLEEGVAMTLGPVNEPYLTAFPLPHQFFPLILSGQYSMAEVLRLTLPYSSWMITVLGDPLYNPFKAKPQINDSELRSWVPQTLRPQ